jgi:fructose-bisphosphate aldolase class II
MTLVTTNDLVKEARLTGTGIGAFNVVLLEHAEAIVEGAERAGKPVILQISQNCVAYHGSLRPIALASLAIAHSSAVPVLVHLDHADDVTLAREAADIGLHSVMFDGSALPYDDNVELTKQVGRYCHDRGVFLEAELGEVGGKDGVHAPGARTDPSAAKAFVGATGVDWLAVAVGTSHAMTVREAAVDGDLIRRLSDATDVPLVLHGSSGLPDEQLSYAVRSGMIKINISTHLNSLFTQAVRDVLTSTPRLVDPRKYVAPGRDAITAEAARLLTLLAA